MKKGDILKEMLEKAQDAVDRGVLPFMIVPDPDTGNRFAVFPRNKKEEASSLPASRISKNRNRPLRKSGD